MKASLFVFTLLLALSVMSVSARSPMQQAFERAFNERGNLSQASAGFSLSPVPFLLPFLFQLTAVADGTWTSLLGASVLETNACPGNAAVWPYPEVPLRLNLFLYPSSPPSWMILALVPCLFAHRLLPVLFFLIFLFFLFLKRNNFIPHS